MREGINTLLLPTRSLQQAASALQVPFLHWLYECLTVLFSLLYGKFADTQLAVVTYCVKGCLSPELNSGETVPVAVYMTDWLEQMRSQAPPPQSSFSTSYKLIVLFKYSHILRNCYIQRFKTEKQTDSLESGGGASVQTTESVF